MNGGMDSLISGVWDRTVSVDVTLESGVLIREAFLYLTCSYWSSAVTRKSQPAGCTLARNTPSRVDTPPAQVRSSAVPAFAIEEEAVA